MLDGSWDCTVNTPLGVQKSVVTFKTDGMTVAGQGTAPTGETVTLRNIAQEGSKVSWSVSVSKPMKLDVAVSVTMSGNTASGKVKFGLFGSGKVTMTRR